MDSILEVKNLSTHFFTEDGVVKAVDNVSFSLNKGETLAIVGESGCGKSVTALSIMGLVTSPGKIVNGEILFKGENLLRLPQEAMRNLRGNKISIIFQDPFTCLNPVLTIGEQLTEPLIIHKNIDKKTAFKAAVDILKKVNIPYPEKRIKNYPHELSGGQRQRVMIAMAVLCSPEIIIADEPTTALDVTIQAQILDLMLELKKELDSSIILITHNMGIVAQFCEKVLVMYAGSPVEESPTEGIFAAPKHPYTKALLECLPRLDEKNAAKTRAHAPLHTIKGQPPNLINAPLGCKFAPRCEFAMDICKKEAPFLKNIEKDRRVACHLY